jgi:two-component system phosphate regulon sensor histidine kinase PhoR
MSAVPDTRRTVWIVDDSPLDTQRARAVLDRDYAVQTFSDGSAMLEHLASHPPPDVLVLDWVMPGVSGIEVCRFLRSGGAAPKQLAILLLTMQTRTEQIVEGLDAGANDYLVKPYADPELRARVDALVRWNGLIDRAQKAEARVRELLQYAPDPLLSIDLQNRITFANGEAQRMLGEDAEALKGRTFSDVLPGVSVDQLLDAARSARALPDLEVGDQIFSPSVRSLPSEDHAGLTVALRNVTARRQRESRRLDFYSIIAHDLRSPLGTMLMRTDMLLRGRRGVLSAEAVADLRKMETNMRSLVALINDFLEFAQMEEAAHKMDRERIDLAVLINEIVDEFRPLLDNTHQEIRVDAHRTPAVVLGDRRRLQQVLTNLVANAIKFTPVGGAITLRTHCAGASCQVDVQDTGMGIAAEIVPTLFQRYTRAPSGKRDAGGTGLGLLIVREIVEAHGGTVGVESTPGEGSRFWFRLPAADGLRPPRPEASVSSP